MPSPLPDWALCRFQAISGYLALDPARGRRKPLLDALASKIWLGPDGTPFQASAETLRVWLRRYKRHGLDGLQDAVHPKRGHRILTDAEVATIIRLKQEVPERSLERIIEIAEQLALVEKGRLHRSTIYRILRAHGLTSRHRASSSPKDLDRWEAAFPNDLWQSDMLAGPWLPDPSRPGKMKRAWMVAFLDDHSRLILDGRFAFLQDQPTMELVFRRALLKWGIPRRLYFDNGKVYRSRHIARICAHLGIHAVVYTRVRRPEGHGKIEAFNRLIRSAFLPEVETSRIVTIEQLNLAYSAWLDLSYNQHVHGQTEETPMKRWNAAAQQVRHASSEAISKAFLFSELRTPDKSGVFSLCGIDFQVGYKLARRRIEIRFDPEALFEVEAWLDGKLAERPKPLQIHADRRPHPLREPKIHKAHNVEKADWLGHLVATHKGDDKAFDPKAIALAAQHRRQQADDDVLTVLADRLHCDALDVPAARDWLNRFGPLDPSAFAAVLDARLRDAEPRDRHVTHYLETIAQILEGDLL